MAPRAVFLNDAPSPVDTTTTAHPRSRECIQCHSKRIRWGPCQREWHPTREVTVEAQGATPTRRSRRWHFVPSSVFDSASTRTSPPDRLIAPPFPRAQSYPFGSHWGYQHMHVITTYLSSQSLTRRSAGVTYSNLGPKENVGEKALFPLPPTGSAGLICETVNA